MLRRPELALVLITACTAPVAWDDLPNAMLTPYADDYYMADWRDSVELAVEEWNVALGPDCPAAFRVGAHGSPVRFVHFDTTGTTGTTRGGDYQWIVVRGPDPSRRSVLLHELGHAIGLEHTDPDDGPSLMFPRIEEGAGVEQRDIEEARCLLGCGWCR